MIDLKLEREESLERQHEATDRRIAERMATELWLASDKVRVSAGAISDALARRNLSEYSTERVERLTAQILAELEKRRREHQRRRKAVAKAGRKRGRPKIADWLDERLKGLAPSEPDEDVASTILELYEQAKRLGVISVDLKNAWHAHLFPALKRAGYIGDLTLGEACAMLESEQGRPVDEGQGREERVAEQAQRVVDEQELEDRRELAARRQARLEPQLQTVDGPGERIRDAATAPASDPEEELELESAQQSLRSLRPNGSAGEAPIIDLESRRLQRAIAPAPPTTYPLRAELILQGTWGSFTLRYYEGEEEPEVILVGRLSAGLADELAALVLAHKYSLELPR